jgi:predicted ATPase
VEIAGRTGELAALHAAWDVAVRGRAQLVVVRGEAGIGKTALATAFSAEAARGGAIVAWGRAWESGWAPPFWPWTQVIRVLVDRFGEDAVTGGHARLGPLLPEFGRGGVDEGFTEEARFFLFDAVNAALARVTAVQPLVVVLDDLHAADVPTLLLTTFLAGHPDDRALLVLGTFRPHEASQRPDVAELVADLERQSETRIPLGPLDADDLVRLVELETGTSPDASLVSLVNRTSEGNPLFARELVRIFEHAAPETSYPPGAIPATIRDVIDRRLGGVNERTREVLATAAVIGRDFGFDVLAEVEEAAEATAACAEGRRHQIVVGSGDAWSFTHVLLRDALYDSLVPAARADRHRRVGEAIERVYAHDLDPHLAELAQHFLEAPTDVRHAKGLVHAVAAGARARRLLAYEEAAALYQRAIEVSVPAAASTAERCELLVAAGEALVRGGRVDEGRALCAEAFELAEALPNFPLMARAAEWYAGLIVEGGVVNEEAVRLLERALAHAGPDDSEAKALVLGRLAQELTFNDDPERRRRLAREAIAVARRTGSTRTLAETLAWVYPPLATPDVAEEALAVATEQARLAADLGDLELEVRARASRTNQLLELGRIVEFRAEVEWLRKRVANVGAPVLRWIADFEPVLALVHGDLDGAQELAENALNRSPGQSNVLAGYVGQVAQLAWERGRLIEIEALLEVGGEGRPRARSALRSMLAAGRIQAGRTEEARPELANLVAEVGDTGMTGVMTLMTVGWLAESAALIGDRDAAAILYGLLLPYAGRHIALPIMRPTVYLGTTSRHLGNLANVLGRPDDATAHHRQALRLHAELEAAVYVGYSQFELAAVLVARGRPADAQEAERLLAEAQATAERMGLPWLLTRTEQSARPSTGPVSSREAALVRDGELWSVSYAGTTSLLRDSMGLGYLSRLLRQPGVEIHCLELSAGTAETHAGGDGGPVLDDRAKAAYRSRIEDLDDELSEAERFGDDERAAKARVEKDAIIDELARAVGLGGRDRRMGSAAERARVNVTRHVRGALAKIAEINPALGRHLNIAVRTGHFCAYEPSAAESLVTWRLDR